MIVVRLILHTRSVPTATGKIRISGLYKAIIAMLIESCAIYAVNSLLFIGLQGAHNYAKNIFLSILPETQVRDSPRPQHSVKLSDATANRIGHCFPAHHSTSRR